ncbi:hypothetical protein C8Q76DRAFT_270492 [Earliella scabrosa]|nr:hypothetical protein C8Q76DRAFT_270492 [Earliella scabrosa]
MNRSGQGMHNTATDPSDPMYPPQTDPQGAYIGAQRAAAQQQKRNQQFDTFESAQPQGPLAHSGGPLHGGIGQPDLERFDPAETRARPEAVYASGHGLQHGAGAERDAAVGRGGIRNDAALAAPGQADAYGQQSTHPGSSAGQRMMGSLEKATGKVTRDPALVERGKARKGGDSQLDSSTGATMM